MPGTCDECAATVCDGQGHLCVCRKQKSHVRISYNEQENEGLLMLYDYMLSYSGKKGHACPFRFYE